MKHLLNMMVILLTLVLLQFTESIPVEPEIKADPAQYRLPTGIRPSNYNISIKPYILKAPTETLKFTFDGLVTIKIQAIEENLKKIVLHKKFITILEKELSTTSDPPNQIVIENDEEDNVTDFYTLNLKEALKKNVDYILKLNYTGVMKDDMKGFYKSNYIDSNGKEVWIGSTQFQTHHARRAFPCFDEPQFKATFDIAINHDKSFKTVVSNMKAKSSDTSEEDRTITTFEQTPIMSTYIVAFLVSNFQGPNKDGFSVIARPEYEKQTDYSFKDGKKLLTALENYFGLKYYGLGNDKMHMAAIPDFSAGAMENWGLLTYRERGLLYDPKETTDSAQQSIALVIAHEQTHMWFGDYVTCDWWNHTWLNEGFATYFQYVAAIEVYPKWELDKQFVVDQIHTVFVTDSLSGTHPMSDKNINTPTDLAKMFDSISYNKGASIIRMFKYAMGEEKFKTALKNYLKDRKHIVSKPEFLFKSFENEWKLEGLKTRQFFTEWTEQVGYPVVSVKVKDGGKKIEISQKRYLLETEEEASKAELKYTIPFTYTTQKNPKFTSPKPENITFISDTKTIELPEAEHLNNSEYIIANIEQMGYFRVLYETDMLHNIHAALETENFGQISDVNRAHLIDDLFNFGRSAHLTYDVVFDVLSYLEKETNYLAWTAAFNGFKNIETRLGTDTDDLKNRLHKILSKVYDHLTFDKRDNESRLDTYNRAKVLQWACKYDFKDCNEKSKKLFEELQKDETKTIDKNIRSVVYCSAIRNAADLKRYEFLEKKFTSTSTVPTEKTLVLGALGCVKEKEHIEKYYKFILTSAVRKQDRSAALNSLIAENPENAEHVFNLIKEDHKELGEALGGGDVDVASVVSNIAGRFTKVEQKKLIEEFAKKLDKSTKETIEKAIKKIDKNVNWVQKYKSDLIKGLRGGVDGKTLSKALLVFTTVLCFIMRY